MGDSGRFMHIIVSTGKSICIILDRLGKIICIDLARVMHIDKHTAAG